MLEFLHFLGGESTKIAPTGDILNQPPCERSSIRTKLADRYFQHAHFIPIVTVGKRSAY